MRYIAVKAMRVEPNMFVDGGKVPQFGFLALHHHHHDLTSHSLTMPADAQQPINCKLLLIGNSSVGKSSLLLRFSDEQWLPEDESSATIGAF